MDKVKRKVAKHEGKRMVAKKEYGFREQLEKGQEYEAKVVEQFKRWYTVEEATKEDQRDGIDFFIQKGGDRLGVEVKADSLTQKTGNVFMESWSVMEKDKKGWVFTSKADILVYIVLPHDAYATKMETIRNHITGWFSVNGERYVRNKGYTSAGTPVPLEEFKKVCPLKFKV